jgi:hypothetical protein
MQFRLRTLLIFLALGPPVIALEWWYWKQSSFALLPLIVVTVCLILWLLNLILSVLARICDALCQLIAVKRRSVPADDSKRVAAPKHLCLHPRGWSS